LHDLAHLPFGHTLEDEGSLFPPQWEDVERVDYYIGEKSEVGKIIICEVGHEFLSDVAETLRAHSQSQLMKLSSPFIADIVGDTLCADLLDYGRRDSQHLGLVAGNIDVRITRYLFLANIAGCARTVLQLSDDKGEIRMDVASELLNLLRLRYTIMEHVHFHRTKIAASAMIIDAVYDSLRERRLFKKDLFELGDEELLFILRKDGTAISEKLVAMLTRRFLYKPFYTSTLLSRGDCLGKRETRKQLFDRFADPRERWKAERELEKANRLPPGTIVLYCPRIKKSEKSATLKVKVGDKISSLRDIPSPTIREQIRSIERGYHYLPKLYVFIEPTHFQNDLVRRLVRNCQYIFQMEQ